MPSASAAVPAVVPVPAQATGEPRFNFGNVPVDSSTTQAIAEALRAGRVPAVLTINLSSDPGSAEAHPVIIHHPVLRPAATESRTNNTDAFLSQCTEDVQEYIGSFKRNPTVSDRINELKLTEAEKKLFEKFEDSIIMEYMARPVLLNGRCYDIETVRSFEGKDPNTRRTFTPSSVQPGRMLVDDLDKAIETLNRQRESRQDQSVSSSSSSTSTTAAPRPGRG